MQDMWYGTIPSRMFQGGPHEGEVELRKTWHEDATYVHQTNDNNKKNYVRSILQYLKINI
jgi:hypothetical protein